MPKKSKKVAFNPNCEMETELVAVTPVMAPRPKAVLKQPHSRRWREVRGGHAHAKRLDCGGFSTALRLPETAARTEATGVFTSACGFDAARPLRNPLAAGVDLGSREHWGAVPTDRDLQPGRSFPIWWPWPTG